MSGWIRLDKALLSDVRFRRMIRRAATECNVGALQGPGVVTLLLGALSQLWLYADEHIRDDNTILATVDDIDQIVGVQNFCKILPTDWLVIVDADYVELPDFLEHNGTVAKKKSLNQLAVARHRAKANGNPPALPDESPSNAPALPDHPIPSQTISKNKEKPDGLDLVSWGRWIEYRKRIKKPLRDVSIPSAERAMAKFGSRQAEVVEYSIANGWLGLFEPKSNGNGHPTVTPVNEAAWAETKAHAAAIGFREPWAGETLGSYTGAIKIEESKRNATPPGEAGERIKAIAAKLRTA